MKRLAIALAVVLTAALFVDSANAQRNVVIQRPGIFNFNRVVQGPFQNRVVQVRSIFNGGGRNFNNSTIVAQRGGFNSNIVLQNNRSFFAPSNVVVQSGFVGNNLVAVNTNPYAAQAVLLSPSAAFSFRQSVPAVASFQTFAAPVCTNSCGFSVRSFCH